MNLVATSGVGAKRKTAIGTKRTNVETARLQGEASHSKRLAFAPPTDNFSLAICRLDYYPRSNFVSGAIKGPNMVIWSFVLSMNVLYLDVGDGLVSFNSSIAVTIAS